MKEKILLQICVSRYQIQLKFEDSLEISIEKDIELIENSIIKKIILNENTTNTLNQLIGEKLAEFNVKNSHIEFLFSNQTKLKVPLDDQYENVVVNNDGEIDVY